MDLEDKIIAMDYHFTAWLIIALCLLALFGGPDSTWIR